MKVTLKHLVAAATLVVASTSAQAVLITCSAPPGLRALTIDSSVSGSCFGTGSGNLGDGALATLIGGGATLLDRDLTNTNGGALNITGAGSQVGGTWSFASSLTTSYLYFHFGGGGASNATNPDYFIFQLASPTGAASGTWATGGAGAQWNGLSNVALLANGRVPPGNVPEPGTLALLGLGLVGLTVARRKRTA